MTRQFILRARAERDIQSAFEWYESQRVDLGAEFLAALREHLEAVRAQPESNPVLYRGIRRAVVSRFPYLIFYVENRGQTTVFYRATFPKLWAVADLKMTVLSLCFRRFSFRLSPSDFRLAVQAA